MIEFGHTLKSTREAKGLTVNQIAESTHLMAQTVEALENEDFSKIVAPIYGRGFVKLYCEALDIDPKPLVAEFMEIYNGNRPPAIRPRVTAPNNKPTPVAAPVVDNKPTTTSAPAPVTVTTGTTATSANPITQSPNQPIQSVNRSIGQSVNFQSVNSIDESTNRQIDESEFHLEAETIPAAAIPAAPAEEESPFHYADEVPPSASAPSLFPEENEVAKVRPPHAEPLRRPSRFTAPQPIDRRRGSFSFSIPPAVWRFTLLGIIAALLLWGIVGGCRALFNSAESPAKPTAVAPVAETATAEKPAITTEGTEPVQEPRKRVPEKIPALYID